MDTGNQDAGFTQPNPRLLSEKIISKNFSLPLSGTASSGRRRSRWWCSGTERPPSRRRRQRNMAGRFKKLSFGRSLNSWYFMIFCRVIIECEISLSTVRHQAQPRLCKMFSESSTVVMQLPCCPGKQGELSGNGLQKLRNDLMAESVLASSSILIHLRNKDTRNKTNRLLSVPSILPKGCVNSASTFGLALHEKFLELIEKSIGF